MRRGSVSTRLSFAAAAGALVLAACGGGGGDPEADSGSADPSTAEPSEQAEPSESSEAVGFAGVDLGGPELDPASDVASNPLPAVVVDDVTRGKKVNLRNLIPSVEPVLIWMWAPN